MLSYVLLMATSVVIIVVGRTLETLVNPWLPRLSEGGRGRTQAIREALKTLTYLGTNVGIWSLLYGLMYPSYTKACRGADMVTLYAKVSLWGHLPRISCVPMAFWTYIAVTLLGGLLGVGLVVLGTRVREEFNAGRRAAGARI